MADNTTLNTGTGGDVIATDDCAGVKYQIVKLADGTADGTTVIKAGHGTAANAIRVELPTDGTGVIATVGTITNVVHIDDNSGNISIDDGGNSITVDNGGTFAVQATIAAGATAIAKAEDVASADADVGVPAMMVRKATPANTSGTDGDYEFLQGSAGALWTATAATDKTLGAERSINGGAEYETVAASQTAQVLGATGGTGDYIAGVLVVPATTSPGNVILLDNATSITIFTGGASSVTNLVPFFIPLGMISVSGAWKLTTGSNVSCIGIGNFT